MDTKNKSKKPLYSEDWLTASTVLGVDNPFHPVREDLRQFLLLQQNTETVSEKGPALLTDVFKRRKVVEEEKELIPTEKLSLRLLGVPLVNSVISLVAVVWWVFTDDFQNGIRQSIREVPETQDTVAARQRNHSAGMTK